MNAEISMHEANGEYNTRIVVTGEYGAVVNGNTFSKITGLLIAQAHFWVAW